jgi:hypothetical protein
VELLEKKHCGITRKKALWDYSKKSIVKLFLGPFVHAQHIYARNSNRERLTVNARVLLARNYRPWGVSCSLARRTASARAPPTPAARTGGCRTRRTEPNPRRTLLAASTGSRHRVVCRPQQWRMIGEIRDLFRVWY